MRSINSCSLEVCFCGASCRRSDLLLELPEASEESLFVLVPLSFWANKVHFIHYSLVLVGAISTYYVNRQFSWCELPSSEDF